MTICAMCFSSFKSLTSYGLCPDCWSRDRLREWDRLQTAIKAARQRGIAAHLELREWLIVLGEHDGKCAYCQTHWYQHIEVVDSVQGLVYGNVVPICSGCREHRRLGWDAAVSRVRAYLAGERASMETYDPLFLPEEEGVLP